MTNRLDDLQPEDLDEIRRRGIDPAEIEHQLRLLAEPPPPTTLEKSCRVGDGIRRLNESQIQQLEEAWQPAAGRWLKFVPASGAASRMFSFLEGVGDEGTTLTPEALRFFAELQEFAFWPELETLLQKRGTAAGQPIGPDQYQVLLAEVVGPKGLGLDRVPKGLLPFHRYGSGSRTAFTEHIYDALGYCNIGESPNAGATDRSEVSSTCQLHFTVLPDHLEKFRARAHEITKRIRSESGIDLRISFSIQDPSTDTIAVDLADRPLRRSDGQLRFRPSGHGALLANLQQTGADLVFIKNIDNISTTRRHPENAKWKRVLAGLLARLADQVHTILAALEHSSGSDLMPARDFLQTEVCFEFPADFDLKTSADRRAFLIDRLDRPLRICGVVPAAGEPGGGPFWVGDQDGCLTGQIIEGAQADLTDPEQEAVWRSSTHFNPVDLVCALRDRHGRAYDLQRFVDPNAAFVSHKSADGQPLKALERPGLWNGSMAGWNTVFVEVPAETFTPVKTVLDLLRPEHRPEEGS